ncbi:MAG: indolepyruvate ferredoxin oxidoreductase subunit alpha [Actinobacteria bacterium]|nr:indolepyruvate ferredoxin oxidoreductase subunit alpha [Actinomycetota bacterium]MBU1943325.1 indolepyruvate ferredoxin oxidoreductase subunit alpha [Actinomycetota bacterium]MBU2686557.1 indolepyruvate ferredoxin oxidoreductase subunit alpha [Actinomycetota bacterium]
MAERRLMTGNEAVALAAFHAGTRFASAYPGTPSTEILENFSRYEGVYAEWAPNEKVSLEAAIGACLGGVRSLAAMKHVGLNVAADPWFTAPYIGVSRGLVVVSADDPEMHSSQNEQDNRYYAKAAKVPMLEPADSQEAYDLTRVAFEMSERFDTPVLMRMTTRVCHSRSIVEPGEPETVAAIPYEKDSTKRVMIPGHARMRHPVMVRRLDELERFSEEFGWQRVEDGRDGAGVVTSGVAYQYVKEAFGDVGILKLAMTNPLPSRLITDFCSRYEDIYVVEELEPFLQEAVAALGFKPKGKESVPRVGELNVDNVRAAFPELSEVEPPEVRRVQGIPARPPILCAGCPHRGIMYILARLKAIIAGDIGCYTLSVLPPLSAHDCQVCMGASITMGHGLEKALELAQGEDGYEGPGSHRVVSVLGDSTFFHSGVTGLMEMAYNNGRYTVVILDNRTTAMTGFQHHPGTGITLQEDESSMVDMEMLARSLGIKNVRVVDPYDLEECRRVLTEEMNRDAPSVVISRRECVLKVRDREPVYYQVMQGVCNECGLCMGIACPALVKRGEEILILPDSCTGCGVCAQVCKHEAIEPVRQ